MIFVHQRGGLCRDSDIWVWWLRIFLLSRNQTLGILRLCLLSESVCEPLNLSKIECEITEDGTTTAPFSRENTQFRSSHYREMMSDISLMKFTFWHERSKITLDLVKQTCGLGPSRP